MTKRRILALGMDGFEPTLADAFMADGAMPALAALRRRSARFRLDHGDAKRSGLAWEHVSTGLSPADAGRFSAVSFNPRDYSIWQNGTSLRPFVADLPARAVVFDPPYFDLSRAPAARGIVGWGAHDPGIAPASTPRELWSEIESRFGPYPARQWIYGFSWPCPETTRAMADGLVRAVDARAEAAGWLLAERLPDWDLAVVVVSELHSAIEALWHGIDPAHPLHHVPSAAPAGEGMRAVYQAVDRLVGNLVDRFPDATVVTFAAHGMGPNDADLPSMLLLPELLYRNSLGRRLLREPESWANAAGGIPMLAAGQAWSRVVAKALGERRLLAAARRRISRHWLKWRPANHAGGSATGGDRDAPNHRVALDWMPAAAYRRYWPQMRAFALPSFYDGRVRVNLAGREARGKVPLERYGAACDEVEGLVRACRDTRTGKPVVARVQRTGGIDPLSLGPTAADVVIDWESAPLGFDHPTLGRIGPAPYRRTGGHTGRYGFAFVAGHDITAGDHGVRSTFDVVPTLIDLLQAPPPSPLSGTSFLPGITR